MDLLFPVQKETLVFDISGYYHRVNSIEHACTNITVKLLIRVQLAFIVEYLEMD